MAAWAPRWPSGQRSRPKVLTCRSPDKVELHPVQQRALGDRAGMGRPLPQGLAVALPGPADVARRDGGKGISSTESTSICAGPTRYRPPGRTLGRRHSRKDTVMSPASTASRRSRLNSTSRCYVYGPARQRPRPVSRACLPRGAASVHLHLSGQRRDRSVVALADLTPPAQRLLERANIWRLGTLTTATIDT
jgi:hypothetical protein